MTIFFLPSFEDGGVERIARRASASFASFFLVIRVHSFVGDVDSGVLRVSGGPWLAEGDLFSERWRLRFFLPHPDILGACWSGLLLWRIGDAV